LKGGRGASRFAPVVGMKRPRWQRGRGRRRQARGRSGRRRRRDDGARDDHAAKHFAEPPAGPGERREAEPGSTPPGEAGRAAGSRGLAAHVRRRQAARPLPWARGGGAEASGAATSTADTAHTSQGDGREEDDEGRQYLHAELGDEDGRGRSGRRGRQNYPRRHGRRSPRCVGSVFSSVFAQLEQDIMICSSNGFIIHYHIIHYLTLFSMQSC
jgi:hypothetical protein